VRPAADILQRYNTTTFTSHTTTTTTTTKTTQGQQRLTTNNWATATCVVITVCLNITVDIRQLMLFLTLAKLNLTWISIFRQQLSSYTSKKQNQTCWAKYAASLYQHYDTKLVNHLCWPAFVVLSTDWLTALVNTGLHTLVHWNTTLTGGLLEAQRTIHHTGQITYIIVKCHMGIKLSSV